MRSVRIGIDVGGTHTDAVALDESDAIVAWTKSMTTEDVEGGIESALDAIIKQLGGSWKIAHVLLGTTHGINAVVQRRNLCRVATIRLGAPATQSIPPLISWPDDLRAAVSAGTAILPGGSYFEGREITKIDPVKIRQFLDECDPGFEAVAVTGVFSPAYRDQELQAADIVREHLGAGFPVSLSHEVGSLGLLARENATVLNAALFKVAGESIAGVKSALKKRGIDAPTFFAQNDGTLMGGELAARYPVMTIGSGPANSIRGAAFLTGLDDAIVADVGGTTTDFGVLIGGFPREAARGSDLGKVRTNFRMPDILSLSLGGGTVVRAQPDEDASIGPDSLGYRLPIEGWSFGGDSLTLTDAGVAAGRTELGSRIPDASIRSVLARGLQLSDERIADAIETMNLGQGFDSLVVVGGGSFLVSDRQPGVKTVIRPEGAQVANAVGVAVAPVSARWDTIITSDSDRRRVIAEAQEIAISRAVQAGADPKRVEIVEMDEVALNYLAQPAFRLKIRAAGPLGVLA